MNKSQNQPAKAIAKTAREKIKTIVDTDSFKETDQNLVSVNPLQFPEYDDKLKRARANSFEKEAAISGTCTINKKPCVLLAFEPLFMMGSMGSVVGEKITRAFELATRKKLPVITIAASGGARMQEGVFSLMQMLKTSAAVYNHSQKGLLFISVLSNPTLGGVTASFATLGDIIIAEENAQIGFTGKRIIEETTGKKLPDTFQSAKFAKEHGFADIVVREDELRATLSKLLQLHS